MEEASIEEASREEAGRKDATRKEDTREEATREVGRSNLSSLWGGQVATGKSYRGKSKLGPLFLHEEGVWGHI